MGPSVRKLSPIFRGKIGFEAAGLKHRSQVTGHRSRQVTGQVNRKNIFLPRKLTIFLGYTFIKGVDNVNWPPHRDFGGAYKLFILGTVSCFSEMNIHRF